MNKRSKEVSSRNGRNGRHRPVRWFSVLMGAAILLTSGAVIADVVLQYVLISNVGAAGTSPFAWGEGSNWQTAKDYGVLGAESCQSGNTFPTNCYLLTTTVNGIDSVPTEVVNAYNFNLVTATDAWTISYTSITPVAAATSTVGCAYALISDAAVGADSAQVGGNGYVLSFGAGATPCASVTVAKVGTPALNTACATSASSSAGATLVDLATATTTGSITPWTCVTTAGTTGVALDVSYFVLAASGQTLTNSQIYIGPYTGA